MRIFFEGFYLFHLRERERQHTWEGGEAEGEGGTDSLLSRAPNAGLNPRTLRSRSEPKADAQPLRPPGVPPLKSVLKPSSEGDGLQLARVGHSTQIW